MMVLHPASSTESQHQQATTSATSASGAAASPSSSTSTSSTNVAAVRAMRARRRSKGTIAGFANSKENNNTTGGQDPAGERSDSAATTTGAASGGGVSGTVGATRTTTGAAGLGSNSGSSGNSPIPLHRKESGSVASSSVAAASSSSTTAGASPSNATTSKPCHSAQLALVCAQNALAMGSRTHLNLCPAGRARRELSSKLQQRQKQQQQQHAGQQQQQQQQKPLSFQPATGGYFGLDKMLGADALAEYPAEEEEYLLKYQTISAAAGNESDEEEELSSGDEEDLVNDMKEFFSEESIPVDDLDRYYQALQEPLFTAVGSGDPLNNSTVGHSSHMPTSGGGIGGGAGAPKLAFNRRKIRYFDSATAADSLVARSYLDNELRRSKKRSGILLSRHLRQVQREERRRKRFEKGEATAEDKNDPSVVERETPEEKELLEGGISRLETPMTNSVAAALMLESLSLNRVESVEGMSKCYDGIVAAGMAILDSQTTQEADPSSPTAAAASAGAANDNNSTASGTNSTSNNKAGGASRSEILSALAPLLITSLEQPSGDVILMLAKLRRMCGTFRYQRRFVQRVAPLLIRPPRGAIWCLRHQNDMEAILAAAELIFDAAFDIFSKGWYERGQLLLADSKRAKTLDTAAQQLRSLSHEPTDSFNLGLSSGHGGHKWMAAKKRKDVTNASSEPLAEWEVVAVVRQIKVSISNVMATDWSRVTAQAEVPRPFRRGYHHHLHTGKSSRSVLQSSSMEAASPKSMSPRSPSRALAAYPTGPKSPPHVPAGLVTTTSAAEAIDSVFGPSFTSAQTPPTDRAMSPPPPASMPTSPPIPHRTTKDFDSKQPGDPYSTASTTPPPKSPKSPQRDSHLLSGARASEAAAVPPLSPKRGKSGKDTSNLGTTATVASASSVTSAAATTTPLSPSASSVGTTGSGEMISYRPSSSSVSSMASAPGATTSYRMLTSTAAERKRTVAACRALRAQIQRFEDAFIQLHGRPPKGAAERAPLATTYAQYREWKRAIRADAACRIQALLRGAHTRSKLLRRNDGKLSRIVMKRPGRPGYEGANSIINKISIPEGITDSPTDNPSSSLAAGVGGGSAGSNATDSFGTDAALAPRWTPSIRRRPNSGDRAASDSAFPGTSPGRRTFSSPAPGSPSSTTSELSHLSLEDLQSRKRDLKRQLKQYDITFARRYGRMPVKAEKEPIRHLYESYNALKGQIALAEQEGRHSHPSSPLPGPMAPLPRSESPSGGGGGGSESGQSGTDQDSPVRGATGSLISGRSSRNRLPRDAPSPASAAAPAATANNSLATQDLQSLRAEKTQLHQMLRSYEREFYEEHRRQVSSFGDIRPVAAQYRRYKEIKRAIAALQQRSGDR